MTDITLKQEEMFSYIANLLQRVRKLERTQTLAEKLDDLESGEQPQDGIGGLPFTEALYAIPVCKVTSLTSDGGFRARLQVPADDANGWKDDPFLTAEIDVMVPPNGSAPQVDDYVGARFTGLFTRFTGGSTLTFPRYGLFGGGASVSQAKVLEINDNTLLCVLSDGTTDTDTIIVARPWLHRRTTYEVGGVYTYQDAQTRTATSSVREQITASYSPALDFVFVTQPTNGTGISSVTWLDLNSDGRAWAEEVA